MDAPFDPIRLADHQYRIIETWHRCESTIVTWEDAMAAILPTSVDRPDLLALIDTLTLINTYQWHAEDQSRRTDVFDAVLGQVKKRIDASNHRRVRAIEAVDTWFAEWLAARTICPSHDAPMNSETIGSIIDRLSVLRLKRYHAPEAKQALLSEQERDLETCLQTLLAEILQGRKRHKIYYQCKMYGTSR